MDFLRVVAITFLWIFLGFQFLSIASQPESFNDRIALFLFGAILLFLFHTVFKKAEK